MFYPMVRPLPHPYLRKSYAFYNRAPMNAPDYSAFILQACALGVIAFTHPPITTTPTKG